MPLYTYYCNNCDKDIEMIISICARDDQMCVECGYRLIRNIDRPVMVWSPKRNGGYSL